MSGQEPTARLRKAFRLGVMREAGSEFRAIATVGLAKDGGIFIAPLAVREYGWTYGVVRPGAPSPGEHVTTDHRPKLHYHQSGVASVTLSGRELERRSLRLPPLLSIERAQVLSVVSSRLWEFPPVAEFRRGDVFAPVRTWPQSAGFSLSVIVGGDSQQRNVALDDMAPMGLIPDPDATRFTVDLAAYGRRALLVGRASVEFEPDGIPEPGTTVAAIPWTQDGRDTVTESFALWTSSLRNPSIFYDDFVP